MEDITNSDLGSMYLIFDKALIARSSNSILFFKIDEETGLWTQYHQIDKMRGQIFFIKGNIRFQIVTDEKVYFYLINKETLIPELENCMFNFMKCSMMMIGPAKRYSVCYKTNEEGITIYTRKFYHNFKVNVDAENLEGSKGLGLPSLGSFVMGNKQDIRVFDQLKFVEEQSWKIPSSSSQEDEILHIAASSDD